MVRWWKNKTSAKTGKAENKAEVKTETKTDVKSVVWLRGGECHEDPKEVAPALWCGSKWAAEDMALMGLDVLVPLASLDGDIWETGWRGEILYVPIEDYGVLPQDVLARYARRVADLLCDGKRVGVFCVGGHGRAGYFAAAVLGLLYPEIDPVEHLRGYYCEKAVETEGQLRSLAEFLNRPELTKHGPSKTPDGLVALLGGGEVITAGGAVEKRNSWGSCYTCEWLSFEKGLKQCDWHGCIVEGAAGGCGDWRPINARWREEV